MGDSDRSRRWQVLGEGARRTAWRRRGCCLGPNAQNASIRSRPRLSLTGTLAPVTTLTIARIEARIGSVPYRYDLADDGTTLVPNESEQAVIADVRAMRTRGMKLQQIADAFSRRRVPTKTGKANQWAHQAPAKTLAHGTQVSVSPSAGSARSDVLSLPRGRAAYCFSKSAYHSGAGRRD